MTAAISPFRWLSGNSALGEIFCVSFFRGLTPAEVLRRFGPEGATNRAMNMRDLWELVDEYTHLSRGGNGGGYVGVLQAGEWSVALEPLGWYAVLNQFWLRLSRGCEMVAVSRHDYAEDDFVHVIDGELFTRFSPRQSTHRWGRVPDALNPALSRAGLPTEDLDGVVSAAWDRSYGDRIARAFAVAAEVTGVTFTRELLDGPLLVGPVDQSPLSGPQPENV
ncbi:hypothetical protein DZF91_18275 [Actinomadura logoneensis]|uniref:Uncharacterized protein n=1 Tax=Actinomadura logoneensis TaxID=2293572 RepID=A0A372JJN9_9ACTN|nr:DUF6461 domain-containing protein [Actinomadura logoneensis]RFU40225.1 hypothetical protein DZF91_18275 [Actinomadura logoneensis]